MDKICWHSGDFLDPIHMTIVCGLISKYQLLWFALLSVIILPSYILIPFMHFWKDTCILFIWKYSFSLWLHMVHYIAIQYRMHDILLWLEIIHSDIFNSNVGSRKHWFLCKLLIVQPSSAMITVLDCTVKRDSFVTKKYWVLW